MRVRRYNLAELEAKALMEVVIQWLVIDLASSGDGQSWEKD